MKFGAYLKDFKDTYSILPHLDIVYGRFPRRLVILVGFLRWELEMWIYPVNGR